jgi:phosphatidate phosphatase APP1
MTETDAPQHRGRRGLHALALRAEDLVQRSSASVLLRAGRRVRVVPFSGTSGTGGTRVSGRVLVQLSSAQPPTSATGGWQLLRANLVPFVTVEVPHARVRVDVGGRSRVLVADREGYVSVVLDDLRLPPGRHPFVLTPVEPAGGAAHGTVHAPDPSADVALVSDIDDTVVDSGVAHGPVAMVRTVLLSDATARVPLTGAPELYRALAQDPAGGPDRPVHYVSTSPWNLAELLEDFLQRHGFPSGPLSLTDWGPGRSGLLRIGAHAHKLGALRRIAHDLPGPRLVLLGDSGQADAEIYAAFAADHPGRVAAVYIRRAGLSTPARQARLDAAATALERAGVPFVVADDSAAFLAHARATGLVAPAR